MAELTARLRLIADVRNFSQNLQRGAQQARTALSGLDRQVGRVGTGLNSANKASKGFFQTLRSNVATQIKAGIMFATLYQALITFRQTIGAAISELLSLDTALRKVQSITKDSDQAIDALGKTLLKLAREGKLFGQTAGEVATGMFEIVQAGFGVSEALDIALVSAMAATAGFTDAATAGKVITGVLLAYGLAAEEAAYVGNLLFQTVDTGVIKFEELANGLGVTLAPAAALGVPLEEILSAVAAMTRKGVPAARAFTAITRMLFGFLDPSDQAAQNAKDIGFELSAATIEANGFMGAMMLLNEATDEDSELLADLFDRQRALIGAFTLLTDGGDEWNEVQGEMMTAQEGNGALMDAWIERQKALSVRLEIFRAQILSLVVTALKPFSKGLGEVIGWLSRMVADEMGVFAWIKEMAKISGLTEAWLEFVDAIKALFEDGEVERLGALFYGMFVIVREGTPVLFDLLVLLLRFGTWAVGNKAALISLAVAFGAMFISAHPLLATFAALLILIAYMDKNWDDWRVKIGGVAAAIALVTFALKLLWDAFTMSRMAMSLFSTALPGLTASTNLLKRALVNAASGVVSSFKPMVRSIIYMATETANAAKKAGTLAFNLAKIIAMPANIARKITVTTLQAGQKAVSPLVPEPIKKGLTGGLVQGLSKGIGAGVGAAIVTGIILALKFAAVALTLTAGVIALAVVIVLITAIVAGFLIYKYRKEIWAGLKTLGRVLKEFFMSQLPGYMQEYFLDPLQKFFTETLPAWARSQFTADNMGRWFGRLLMAAIITAFWPVLLIYVFRDKLLAFVDGIAGFLAELPGMIADFIGDHWKKILFALFPVQMAIIEWRSEIAAFLMNIAEFVAGIPGQIVDFIGDHWKKILFALFPVQMAIIEFRGEIATFLMNIAEFVAGIPGQIADFIGDHWKEIIGFLVNPQEWYDLFKSLVQAFVDLVSEKIGPMLSGIGNAIAGGIKGGITSAFSGLGDWIINAAKGALGPVAGWLAKGASFLGAFFGGVPSGMQDVINWLEGGSGSSANFGSGANSGPQQLANGIRNFMGGMALVGERGAELIKLPRGADVVRNADMGQAMRGAGAGGGVSVSAEVNITTSMMREYEDLKKRVIQEVEEKLDDAAATAGLAKPRLGTLGAGIPRT